MDDVHSLGDKIHFGEMNQDEIEKRVNVNCYLKTLNREDQINANPTIGLIHNLNLDHNHNPGHNHIRSPDHNHKEKVVIGSERDRFEKHLVKDANHIAV